MSDFVKPKRVEVSADEYIRKLIETPLIKDLHDNEEICPYCHGAGMEINDNIYGLSNDPNKAPGNWFPYKHQALTFCRHCFNGVVNRCTLCGEIIAKGYSRHNCDKQRELDLEERKRKELENLEKATEISADKCNAYYYEGYPYNEGYFQDFDEFLDWWQTTVLMG